jgi:uncharacterized membrane protein
MGSTSQGEVTLKTKVGQIINVVILVLVFLSLAVATPQPGKAQEVSPDLATGPVVRAIMFWMETCGHCHYILEEVLPPLQEKYGDQFQILLVELVTTTEVDLLYQVAEEYGIPVDQVGVPLLVIGERVLSGSVQIPTELPGLIEGHLAAGGLDYPDRPAVQAVVQGALAEGDVSPPPISSGEDTMPEVGTPTPVAVGAIVEGQPQGPQAPAIPKSDGFTLAISIMVGMVAAVVYAGGRFVRGSSQKSYRKRLKRSSGWVEYLTPLLAVLGLGVAGYLAYVETQAVTAICGPVGDCNTVQSSPYARLFGVLHIGVLGVVGYILILAAWMWKRLRSDRLAMYASLAIFGMAFFGTLFSLYLTYLEPFVIRAVCAWCLASAVLITLLMLVNVTPALQSAKIKK